LRPLLRIESFKKYAPTVYWIHEKGFALVCKYVNFGSIQDWQKRVDMKQKIISIFESIGVRLCDLHGSNLVVEKKTKHPLIVDYGCFINA